MKVFPRTRTAYALSLVLCTLLLIAMALPAAAAKPAGKGGKSKAAKATTSQVTEDNDTNDGGTPNNRVDDGDNRHPSGKDKSVERGGSGNQGNSTSDPDDDGRGPDRSNGGADKPDGPGGVDLADQDGNNGCGNDDDFEDDNEGWCGGKPKPAKGAPAAEEPDTDDSCTPSAGAECTPAEGPCTVGSENCTPDVNETCEVAGDMDHECLGLDEGACDGTTAGCTPELPASDTPSPSLVDKEIAADEVLSSDGEAGPEGQVEDETDVAGVTVERPEADLGTARVLGEGAAAGEFAAVGSSDSVLAATGAPLVVLMLLALGGLGLGTGLVRRGRRQ